MNTAPKSTLPVSAPRSGSPPKSQVKSMNEAIMVTGMCQEIVRRINRYSSPIRMASLLTSPMLPGIRPRNSSRFG